MGNNRGKTPQAPLPSGEKPRRKSVFQRFEEHIWGTQDEAEQGFNVFFKRWLQILDRAFIGFYKNKCFESASALTYTSILTIVPLLALLLAVLKGFGVHQSVHDAMRKLPFVQALRVESIQPPDNRVRLKPVRVPGTTSATLPIAPPAAPDDETTSPLPLMVRIGSDATTTTSPTTVLTGEQVADQIFIFVENTNISNLGVIGLLGLLGAVMALLSRIENAMNEAWAVHRSRTFARKLSDYLNMLVIVLLMLAGLSVTVTAKVSDVTGFFNRIGIEGMGETLLKAVPYLIVWPAFVFMYFYIPNTRVKPKSALVSGFVAGTLFQILQVVFIRTQILVGKYNKIYGIFAIILIVLVWAYFSWCIVLWGAEVCSAHQNLRDWRRRRRRWTGTPAERETLALRVAALLAAPLLAKEGAKRMDAGDLADTLMLPLEPVGEIIDLFQNNGLLIQSAEDGAFIFARSPESITALDLLRLVRQGTMEPAAGANGWLGPVAREVEPVLAGKTLKSLVELPLDDIKTFFF